MRVLSEYRTLFDARGARYNAANRLYPEARAEEARHMLARVPLRGGALWLDVGAGGGFLGTRAEQARAEQAGAERAGAEQAGTEKGSPGAAAVGCDESAVFLGDAGGYAMRTVAAFERLPFAPGSFDAAASLAALHHAEEPRAVIAEMLRVVREGGRVAVGDVAAGSAAAGFLNGFVNAHTGSGHRGRFYRPDDWVGLLNAAGGRGAEASAELVHWRFASAGDAARFCRELFGLDPDTREDSLEAALGVLGGFARDGGWLLPWEMVFASAAR